MTSAITPNLPTMVVYQLHALTLELISKGYGTLPVCTTDGRARYPFQAFASIGADGVPDALLIYPRPDAHFLPVHWPEPDAPACKTPEWNELADEMKRLATPFQPVTVPPSTT